MKRIASVLLILLLVALAADARVGGGQSYGGSSSGSSGGGYSGGGYSGGGSSSSSGGGFSCGGAFFFLLFFIVLMAVSYFQKQGTTAVLSVKQWAQPGPFDMTSLRQFDPNFSQIVFTDFCYSLFARFYEALGRGEVDNLAPYVSKGVRDGLKRYAAGLTSIDEVVIGSFAVVAFRGLDQAEVEADVEFEANYTETRNDAVRRYYVREVWTLTRGRDVLSPTPDKAKAEHCPKCGAPLQTRTDGACLHCGTVISDGSFQWFVRAIRGVSKEDRPRDLGGTAEEAGTDLNTIYQPDLARKRKQFEDRHPGFSWDAFLKRVDEVANELQKAWASRDWQHAEAYETGPLFQMHRYWIDEYLRQHLRNVVDNYAIQRVVIVKVASDAFYDAITVRLYASGNDYTIADNGTIVGGSPSSIRLWSEYWTLIRGTGGVSADTHVCPNCGAPIGEGQTVICRYCRGKIVRGEFPWILSRIEQDEAYRG